MAKHNQMLGWTIFPKWTGGKILTFALRNLYLVNRMDSVLYMCEEGNQKRK